MSDTPIKNDEYWRQELDEYTFDICRNKGTERPFTGKYCDHKAAGIYVCRCCGQALFDAHAKYDSGSGWPSFYQPVESVAVSEHRDVSHAMTRTEITCAKCDSHLGHVFADGPKPTGQRYCVNSASLSFQGVAPPEE